MDSFVQDYKIHVFNIAYLSKEIRNQFTSDFKIVADYFAEKDTPDYKPEDKEIKHVEGVLQMLRVFTDDTRYDMIKADVINREKRGGKVTMCTFVDRMVDLGIEQGLEQGIEQGLEQGREKEAYSNAVMFFKNGASFELVAASITSISREELEKIHKEVVS